MAHSERLIAELEAMRTNLAKHCLTEFSTSNQGHAGGTMSILELVTALYFHHFKFDPENVDWPERDRARALQGACLRSHLRGSR